MREAALSCCISMKMNTIIEEQKVSQNFTNHCSCSSCAHVMANSQYVTLLEPLSKKHTSSRSNSPGA